MVENDAGQVPCLKAVGVGDPAEASVGTRTMGNCAWQVLCPWVMLNCVWPQRPNFVANSAYVVLDHLDPQNSACHGRLLKASAPSLQVKVGNVLLIPEMAHPKMMAARAEIELFATLRGQWWAILLLGIAIVVSQRQTQNQQSMYGANNTRPLQH